MPLLKRIKLQIFTLISVMVAIIFFVMIFNLFILILPFIIILVVLGYLFKSFNKLKNNEKKEYLDIGFKMK